LPAVLPAPQNLIKQRSILLPFPGQLSDLFLKALPVPSRNFETAVPFSYLVLLLTRGGSKWRNSPSFFLRSPPPEFPSFDAVPEAASGLLIGFFSSRLPPFLFRCGNDCLIRSFLWGIDGFSPFPMRSIRGLLFF